MFVCAEVRERERESHDGPPCVESWQDVKRYLLQDGEEEVPLLTCRGIVRVKRRREAVVLALKMKRKRKRNGKNM